jgi:hypothetical protein
MVTIEPLAFCQSSLMLTYQGHGATAGIGTQVSQIALLKDEMVERISHGFLPIVIEGNQEIAWIYLNTVDDPRGYEGEDFDGIQTDYEELFMDLFPIRIDEDLKKLLNKQRGGYKQFFKTIGVEYLDPQKTNGEIVSKINYDKFDKFVY